MARKGRSAYRGAIGSGLPDLVGTSLAEPQAICGVKLLLDGLARAYGAQSARVYKLSFGLSTFRCISGFPSDVEDFLDPRVPTNDPFLAGPREAIDTGDLTIRAHSADGAGGVMQFTLPVLRGRQCTGFIELRAPAGTALDLARREIGLVASHTCASLLERMDTFELLRAIQRPIDYHQGQEPFLDELMLTAAQASGMPILILRELYDDTRLQCLARFGLPDDTPNHDFDIGDIEQHPRFRHVIRGRLSWREGSRLPDSAPAGSDAPDMPAALQNIRSYVITPVLVGNAVFGTLSFGYFHAYEYSPLEIAGYEGIAAMLGTAITSYRNYHKQSVVLGDLQKAGVQITAIEVAQAARHEARNYLDLAQLKLATLERGLGRTDLARHAEAFADISQALRNISFSLDKIRAVTKPPAEEAVSVQLRQLIDQAIGIVRGRLVMESIQCRMDGPDVTIQAYEDFLVHAFLNLLLNSIDAFREYGRRTNRAILIRITEDAVNAYVTYSDNASGVDPSKLDLSSVPEADRQKPLGELLFLPGVTSKPQGSGFGLHLVRSILDKHRGSINLASHRGGVVFEIQLPIRLRENT